MTTVTFKALDITPDGKLDKNEIQKAKEKYGAKVDFIFEGMNEEQYMVELSKKSGSIGLILKDSANTLKDENTNGDVKQEKKQSELSTLDYIKAFGRGIKNSWHMITFGIFK